MGVDLQPNNSTEIGTSKGAVQLKKNSRSSQFRHCNESCKFLLWRQANIAKNFTSYSILKFNTNFHQLLIISTLGTKQWYKYDSESTNLLNRTHNADAKCFAFCWHVKYKCQPTHLVSETTSKRTALPTQLEVSWTVHTQFTCQTHCNSHYEYAHRLPATQMHHYTHTNATTHPVTQRTTSRRLAEASIHLMGRVLERHQRITAGKYATYTCADADVCIDRNLSSTLETIT